MGQLLSFVGKRVLLMDLDTATLGMTHYFAPRLRPSAAGLLDVKPRPASLQTDAEEPNRIDLFFLPLTADLENPEISEHNASVDSLAQRFIVDARDQFDVIIIDFQAGFSSVLQKVARLLSTVVIVTEADPVSIGAVSRLRRSLGHTLDARIYGLVNKILPDELVYFNALTDLVPDITFLDPLPFDSEVRKAFFRRGDPINPERSGPYGFALLKGLRRVTPQFAASLDEISTEPSERSAENLIELRDQAERNLFELLSRQRRQRLITLTTILATVAVGAIAIPLLLSNKQFGLTWTVAGAVATVIAAALGALTMYRRSTDQDQFKIERQRRLLRQIDERLVEYELANIQPDSSRRYDRGPNEI